MTNRDSQQIWEAYGAHARPGALLLEGDFTIEPTDSVDEVRAKYRAVRDRIRWWEHSIADYRRSSGPGHRGIARDQAEIDRLEPISTALFNRLKELEGGEENSEFRGDNPEHRFARGMEIEERKNLENALTQGCLMMSQSVKQV